METVEFLATTDAVEKATTSVFGWYFIALGLILMTVGIILILRRSIATSPEEATRSVKRTTGPQPEAAPVIVIPIGVALAWLLFKGGVGGILIALGLLLQLGGLAMIGVDLSVFDLSKIDATLPTSGTSTTMP